MKDMFIAGVLLVGVFGVTSTYAEVPPQGKVLSSGAVKWKDDVARFLATGKVLTARQTAGCTKLAASTGGSHRLAFNGETLTPATISSIHYQTHFDDPESAVEAFMAEYWSSLADVFELTASLDFDMEIREHRSGLLLDGYVIDLHPQLSGYPVFADYFHIHLVYEPDDPNGLVVSAITARLHRSLSTAVVGGPMMDGPTAIDTLQNTIKPGFVADTVRLIFDPSQSPPALLYQVHGKYDGTPWEVRLGANSGELVSSQSAVAHQDGKITVPATNTYEAFTGTKSAKPLPNANIYYGVSGTPTRGNSAQFLGKTDYHGNYNLSSTAGQAPLCSTCWAVDHKSESTGNSFLSDTTTAITSFIDILNGILTLPSGATYNIPWSTTNHEGRRSEFYYHLSFARHYYKEFYGVPVYNATYRTVFDTFCNPCGANPVCHPDCSGGGANCNVGTSTCEVTIGCGLQSDDLTKAYQDGEVALRGTTYHEYTHAMDYSSRGYWINLSTSPDFPGQQNYFRESFAGWGSGLVSDFEVLKASNGAIIGDSVSYPADYACTSSYEGVPLTSIYDDYVLFAGTRAIKSILWHLPQLDNATRLLNCQNVASYDDCTDPDTFYSHLVTVARDDWSSNSETVFEVAKAFHNHITDANPGTNTCPLGNWTDPDLDTFPWADDVTAFQELSPFIPLDYVPSMTGYTTSTTPWGQLSVGPDTCTGTSLASCKALALDYSTDYDTWTFLARAGERYDIRTTTTAGADTMMEISSGDLPENLCGVSGTASCFNDDCAAGCPGGPHPWCSCLSFRPAITRVYYLRVHPYVGSEVGASDTYTVVVDQIGDDHGDSSTAATPLPQDGLTRSAMINSSTDADWFYAIVPAADLLVFSVCPARYSPVVPTLKLYDAQLNLLSTLSGTSCSAVGWYNAPSAGTYYMQVYDPGAQTGSYRLTLAGATDIGGTSATALSLADPLISFPNELQAVPSVLSSTSDVDVYKLSASKGTLVQLEAFGNPSATAAPVLRLITPTGSYKTTTSQTCTPPPGGDGFSRTTLNAPAYILRDDRGGAVRGSSEVGQNARMSFVAPRTTDYYIEVSNEGAAGGYVLYYHPFANPLTDYPDLP